MTETTTIQASALQVKSVTKLNELYTAFTTALKELPMHANAFSVAAKELDSGYLWAKEAILTYVESNAAPIVDEAITATAAAINNPVASTLATVAAEVVNAELTKSSSPQTETD